MESSFSHHIYNNINLLGISSSPPTFQPSPGRVGNAPPNIAAAQLLDSAYQKAPLNKPAGPLKR